MWRQDMTNYEYSELFQQDSIDKQIVITFDDTTIKNEDLFLEKITLTENLCSESELRFGSCEASVLQFKVANIMNPMLGKWLDVKMYLAGHSEEMFTLGRYRVEEDKLTADRQWREITAYDAMFSIINTDVAAWYNTVLPNKDSRVTMKQFRISFMDYFGLQQVLPEEGLVNDSMIIEKTIEPSEVSGKDVITSICEINGCFGHIGRDGKFHFIYLEQDIEGLYPANDLYPEESLYPKDVKSSPVGAKGSYIKCDYGDYKTTTINKLQIRQEENDIGVIVGKNGDNMYVIEDNFLVYGKGSRELWDIANNIFNKITDIIYRPFDAEVKGNPCFEVGDPIRIVTTYELVETYILRRTLTGIQALRDDYSAEGVEKYSNDVNSVHKSIVQLKGKTNLLVRTIEETRIQMEDIEKELRAEITINAEQIKTKVTKGTVSSEISQEAGKISISANRISISSDYFILTDDGRITATAGTIGGISIGNGIYATNFSITSGGNATFTGINITSGSGSFSSGFGVSGTAKNQFDNLVASNATIGNLIAQRATIEQLNATNAAIGSIQANYVTVNSLNAVSAKVNNIAANYITASAVKADYMEVANWTTAGHIKAEKIDAETISAKLASLSSVKIGGLSVTSLTVSGAFNYGGKTWSSKTIGSTTYMVATN